MKFQERTVKISAYVFAVAVVFAAACKGTAPEKTAAKTAAGAEKGAPALKVITAGDRAPDFALFTVDGDREVRFADELAKSSGVVVWFTNLCGGCREKMPEMEAAYAAYKGRVDVLAISQLGDNAKPARDAVSEYGLTFPFLLDPSGKVSRAYGNEYVPGTCPLQNIYFIGRDGVVKSVSHYPGLSAGELKGRFASLTQEE